MYYYCSLEGHSCKSPCAHGTGTHFPKLDTNRGTCRYVAMHTMQEEDGQNLALEESQSNGYLEASGARQSRRPKERRSAKLVLAAVGGMLLPLLTQIGHAH